MTSRPQQRRSVFLRERRERPHDIHLELQIALGDRPEIVVAVRILGERYRMDFDGLGQIERDAVAARSEDGFGETANRSDERREGKEHVSTFRSGWSP